MAVKPSTGKPTFTTSTPPGDYWLTVNMDSGTLPASISVEVNPTSLAVGNYTSSVTITVAGVASPAVVTVSAGNYISAFYFELEHQQSDLQRASQSVGRANRDTIDQRVAHLLHSYRGRDLAVRFAGGWHCFAWGPGHAEHQRECHRPGSAGSSVYRQYHGGGFRRECNRQIAKHVVYVTVQQPHTHHREHLAAGAPGECRGPNHHHSRDKFLFGYRASPSKEFRRRS